MTNASHRVVLAIGNTFEFNTRQNKHLPMQDLIVQREHKENFAVSAEMALFWGGVADERVVILPKAPHADYIAQLEAKLSVRIKLLVPKLVTGWVCRDLLEDEAALAELIQDLGARDVIVMPWGVTDYYYKLLDILRARGIKICDIGGPVIGSQWAVDYCDSKVGSRSILEQASAAFPDFGPPPGYICHNLIEAAALIETLSRELDKPMIVKSDVGSGGRGVKLYRASQTGPANDAPYYHFLDLVAQDDLWQNVPIVVETAVGDGVFLSTPSFDGLINPDGTVSRMAVENMLTPERQCVGVEIGIDVLPAEWYEKLASVGEAVGRHLALIGYRGWYDVDFLLPTQGLTFYGSEVNPRRGGGTAPIEIAQRLFGLDWIQHGYFKSFERLWVRKSFEDYGELQEVIFRVNEQAQTNDGGVILLSSTSAMLRTPYLTYFVFAKNRGEGLAIEADLHAQLAAYN